MTVDTFKQEIAEAVKAYGKFIVCLDKTPDDCEGAIQALMEKAPLAAKDLPASK